MTAESPSFESQQPVLREKGLSERYSVKPTPRPRSSLTSSSSVEDYDVKPLKPPPLKPRTKFNISQTGDECDPTPFPVNGTLKMASNEFRNYSQSKSPCFGRENRILSNGSLDSSHSTVSENIQEDEELTYL